MKRNGAISRCVVSGIYVVVKENERARKGVVVLFNDAFVKFKFSRVKVCAFIYTFPQEDNGRDSRMTWAG